jgi:hypothetical protein
MVQNMKKCAAHIKQNTDAPFVDKELLRSLNAVFC